MNSTSPSTAVDLRQLANEGRPLGGETPLAAYERLSSEQPAVAAALGPVIWRAQAEWRQQVSDAVAAELKGKLAPARQLWLHLEVQAQVPQVCQRCLGPFAQPVAVDRWFRFVADEATAAAEDDESEEDVLVMEPRFDLHALIEDELLLALPLIPMHDVCPEPVRMSAGELPEDSAPEKPNPFAALASLRKDGQQGGKNGT
ncbi:YceD family protein [Hydrogenophaga aquatica]